MALVKITKVKDVLPSPFYSGTYHPPDFAAHSPLCLCIKVNSIKITYNTSYTKLFHMTSIMQYVASLS